MLCEIGNSYSFSGKHHEALQVLKQAEKMFKSIGADNRTNSTYNSIIFCLANSNLAQKKYLSALSLFKAYFPSEKEKTNTKLLIQVCKDKIKGRILILAGSIGASILIIKYSIKWFSPDNYSSFVKGSGWVGAILLIAFGLIPNKRKNNR
jgi:tetratricopeptide (TPR) repeat protein